MEWLTLIFPLAAALWILLTFSEILPLLRRTEAAPETVAKRETGMSGRDRAALGLITLAYALTAFLGLGDRTAPQTFCRFADRGQYALAELTEETEIGAVYYYTGLFSGSYRLQFSPDGEVWYDQEAMEQKHSDLFKWQYATLSESRGKTRFVRIIADSRLWLGEVLLYDAEGEPIPSDKLRYDAGTAPLFDEPETAPAEPSYRNSSYFDEIYHARTAFENVENVYPYEVSHPPLGKLLLSLGIRLFGMTPFGWRFVGTLFGVLMLPLLYRFLKRLFGYTSVCACCTAIFAFDFMHFTQTRIATIDTYAVFFTIAMYAGFYAFLTAERDGRPWRGPLALSGVCFGLGAACKWTCLYAGAGLGVLWLLDRIDRSVTLRRNGEGERARAETGRNVLWCLLFFAAVPCLIYYLSYYPYGLARGLSGPGMFLRREYLDIVLDNQRFMFTYHSGVTATHPYSSRWYEWLLDIRPILYYLHYFDDGTKSAFGAFVNPMLCWGGLLAMFCMLYLSMFRRDRKALFILLGYLAQLLPWVFVRRVVFEYHYFPSTVFLLLALGYVFTFVRERHPDWKRILGSYTAASLLLFAAFYPVLSGLRVPRWYTTSFLRWIPGKWPF